MPPPWDWPRGYRYSGKGQRAWISSGIWEYSQVLDSSVSFHATGWATSALYCSPLLDPTLRPPWASYERLYNPRGTQPLPHRWDIRHYAPSSFDNTWGSCHLRLCCRLWPGLMWAFGLLRRTTALRRREAPSWRSRRRVRACSGRWSFRVFFCGLGGIAIFSSLARFENAYPASLEDSWGG